LLACKGFFYLTGILGAFVMLGAGFAKTFSAIISFRVLGLYFLDTLVS
jgi:hypothetical protein